MEDFSKEENGKIILTDENGQEDVFYIVEETKLAGVNYILVTESPDDDEDSVAFILKDISKADDEEAIYEFVEDDEELDAAAAAFGELLEDIDIDQ